MQINDIIEIENDEYIVIDVFEIENNKYALVNLLQEEINPEDTIVLKVEKDMVYNIEEEDEIKKVIKYLDSKKNWEKNFFNFFFKTKKAKK